jgi:hypothetical protein
MASPPARSPWLIRDGCSRSTYGAQLCWSAIGARRVLCVLRVCRGVLPEGRVTRVTTQRHKHRKHTLDADRERRLQDVPGWSWGSEAYKPHRRRD